MPTDRRRLKVAPRTQSWLTRSYADLAPRGAALADASPSWLVALALGAAVFTLDSFTPTDGAASALYGGVLVLVADRREWRGVVAAAGICVLLTALCYFPAHGLDVDGDSIVRRAISLAAIAAACVLTLRTLAQQNKIAEQLQLLDLTNSALFVKAPEGLITYWSAGASRLYGWPASEAVGQDAQRLLQTKLDGERAAQAQLAKFGRWQGDVRQTTREGRQLHVSASWAVQRDEQDRIVGVLETGADVTRRRQSDAALARSEARYRAIFDTNRIAIFEEDFSRVIPLLDELQTAGVNDIPRYIRDNPRFVLRCVELVRIVDVNDGAVRMFHAQGKQELLHSLTRLYLPGSTGSFAEILVALSERRPSCSAQTLVRALDGTPLTVQMSITFPQRRENMMGVLVSIMDVTKFKQAEENLAWARDSLTQLAHVFNLGEVVASIAHEMNQPLAAIVANAEAAFRWLRRSKPDRAEAAAALERIARDGERAVKLLERIRLFPDSASPRRAIVDLSAAIEEAALLLRRELERQEVTLMTELGKGPLLVLGDRVQIGQVVTNLLINAIQALSDSPALPRIVVVNAAEQVDGMVGVTVRDNGPGITPSIRDQMFKPFHTTKAQGIGLGLSISRSIIENHGGTIGICDSVDVTGASLQFTLPIAPRPSSDGEFVHTKV